MAVKGRKSKLGYAAAAEGPFTALAKITEVVPPRTTVDRVDVTHMESPDEYLEREPGWADAGDIEVKIQFAAANAATIQGLSGVMKYWQVEFSDGSTWTAQGFIADIGDQVEFKGIVSTDIKICVTGKPVWAAAA